jgi:hypothetical protein
MANYYVSSSTGNDAWPGTIAQPWQNLSKVTTEFAAGTFNPADQILFKRGDTWLCNSSNRIRITVGSGTAGNYITLGAYDSGVDPIFHCQSLSFWLIWHDDGDSGGDYIEIENIIMQGMQNRNLVELQDVHYCYIHDCTFRNVTSPSSWATGIKIAYSSSYNILSNCEFYNIEGEAIYFGNPADTSDTPHHNIVENCTFDDLHSEAVEMKVGNLYNLVSYCTATLAGMREWSCFAVGGRWHCYYGCDFDFEDERGIALGLYSPQLIGNDPTADTVTRCIMKTGYDFCIWCYGDGNRIEDVAMLDSDQGTRFGTHSLDPTAEHVWFFNHPQNNVRDVYQNTTKRVANFSHYYEGDTVWYVGGDRNLAYVQGTLGQELNANDTIEAFDEAGFLAADYDNADNIIHLQTWEEGIAPLAILVATGNICRVMWHNELDGLSGAQINARLATFVTSFSNLTATVYSLSPLRIEATWDPP